MLVIYGAEDMIAVPANAKGLAAEFPDRVTLVEITNAGHAMLPEQPEQVAKAVLAYLRRTETSPAAGRVRQRKPAFR